MKTSVTICFLLAGCVTADARAEVAKIENADVRVSFDL
jgi:hypothetical protein